MGPYLMWRDAGEGDKTGSEDEPLNKQGSKTTSCYGRKRLLWQDCVEQ